MSARVVRLFVTISEETFYLSAQMATFAQLYSNLFDYPLYIGVCLLLMLVYSFIYMLLAVYVERINPGEFGVAQPWYYPFQNLCCKPQRVTTVSPIHTSVNHWIDPNPVVRGTLPSASTNNLTKKFGKFTALSDLSIRFYMGEVCSLLGHNGAGKTTITFILVGMYRFGSVGKLDLSLICRDVETHIRFCHCRRTRLSYLQ